MSEKSIFERFFSKEQFVDRFKQKGEEGVDVIIPLINTNELWEKNLYSFYREIPINRLLIGDGGCTDNSIKIVEKFPRVTILNHDKYKSQGASIIDLIKNVKTEWFIYLHADIFLPDGWYDVMIKRQGEYDWFECNRKMTTMVEFWADLQNKAERAYSGSQMGRTKAFINIIPKIDDDYLQRNEDIIFHELIKSEGFKYGRVPDTYHYHQIMNRRGEKEPKFKKIAIEKESDKKWEQKIYDMQVRGIIKYLQPSPYLIDAADKALFALQSVGGLNWKKFKEWVKKTNPVWLKYIHKKIYWQQWAIEKALKIYGKLSR